MLTLTSERDRQAIVDRLRRLRPETRPGWGTLTAPRLLCHLADSVRVALGDVPYRMRDRFLTRTLVRWFALYTPFDPPHGKVKTVPEMLATEATSWEADLAALETLIHRLASAQETRPHPAFGNLSPQGWGRLAWKHFDYHLRQFGV